MVGKNIPRFESGRPTTLPGSGYSPPHARGEPTRELGRVNAALTQSERATACGNDGGRDEVSYSSSVTPPARLLFPAGVTAAHRSLEPFDEVRILGGERSRIIVSPMIRLFRMETGSSLSLTCLFGPCGMREVRQRDFLLSPLRRKGKGFGVRPARAEMGAIGD